MMEPSIMNLEIHCQIVKEVCVILAFYMKREYILHKTCTMARRGLDLHGILLSSSKFMNLISV